MYDTDGRTSPPQKGPKEPDFEREEGKAGRKAHRTFHRALGVKLHRKKRSEEINSGKGVGRSAAERRQGCALLLACMCVYVRASDFQ